MASKLTLIMRAPSTWDASSSDSYCPRAKSTVISSREPPAPPIVNKLAGEWKGHKSESIVKSFCQISDEDAEYPGKDNRRAQQAPSLNGPEMGIRMGMDGGGHNL